MVLIIHLLIGNILFFLFLIKKSELLSYYQRWNKILAINAQLKKGINPTVVEAAPSNVDLQNSHFNLFKYLVFYIQFITIAWMLFLTRYLAAAVVLRINPRIKEHL